MGILKKYKLTKVVAKNRPHIDPADTLLPVRVAVDDGARGFIMPVITTTPQEAK